MTQAPTRNRPQPDPPDSQGQHDRQHLQRGAPPGPGGSRGRAQASGHVHRFDRHPRPDALRVGDHRQRGRRGARRCSEADRGHAPPRRLGRGVRRRARHPGRQGTQDRPARRRGDLHQAARGRQVRRRVVRRHRRPARRRCLGRQRAVLTPRRRRRPHPQPAGHVVPARLPRCVRGRWAEGEVPGEVGSVASGKAGRQGTHRHPHPVLAGPADLHQGRPLRVRRARDPGPPDLLHRARPGTGHPRRAGERAGRGELPPRRRHCGVRPVPRCRRARHRRTAAAGHGLVHRDGADARRAGPHDAPGGGARRCTSTSRCAGARATTPSCARSST